MQWHEFEPFVTRGQEQAGEEEGGKWGLSWPVRAGETRCGREDFRAEGGFIPVCLLNMWEKFSCC